jgi:hypothetical protein
LPGANPIALDATQSLSPQGWLTTNG